MTFLSFVAIFVFIITQSLYLLSILIDGYIYTRPVNRVDMGVLRNMGRDKFPMIVLFYPVLHEPFGTMDTTFSALDSIDYPKDRYRVVAIPNHDDDDTLASLYSLQAKYSFLQIMPVPPTSDRGWDPIWEQWKHNPNAYWFHNGPRAANRNLPPKKTRQLIYAFYNVALERGDNFLVNYIDADSAPPRDHFLAAAAGITQYDVLQSRNVAGNLLATMASTMFAFDHLIWDANKYGHLTADGKQPYWMLGKGLFFKSQDLIELGGFHPWITIEDPEVGMRFWKAGKRLGLIDAPLIEEVPKTFSHGVTQRKRWVAGFFQSLDVPLRELGYTRGERLKAWLNFLPCLSLSINAIGIPIGIWALVVWEMGRSFLPPWSIAFAAINILLFTVSLGNIYIQAWKMTKVVLPSFSKRAWYMLRVNPLFIIIYWLWWMIPIWIGWRMYCKDQGLVWERTQKNNVIGDAVRLRAGLITRGKAT